MSIEQEKMIVEALPSLYPLKDYEEDAIHTVLGALPHWISCSERMPGRCFEVLKPFLMMRIESKITVGGMEINIDNGRMTKILAEYDAKTGKVQQAFVIIPSGLEAGFTQAFYDAVKHVIASYKRIKKNELYR